MALQIDLSDAFSEGQSEIVEKIYAACHNRGFFRITNHGIPLWLVEETISAFQLFHEQPMEEKLKYHVPDLRREMTLSLQLESKSTFFYSSPMLELAYGSPTPTDWRDTLLVPLGPEPPATHWIPDNCAREVFAWDLHTRRLGKVLLELMSEGLGLEKGKLEEMGCLEEKEMLSHYYPYGDLQNHLGEGMHLAARPQTEMGVLKLTVENKPGCLEFEHGEEWEEYSSTPDGILVSVGDLLQIMSNDEYKSVKQRVISENIVNPSPLSIEVSFKPLSKAAYHNAKKFGPLLELLSDDKPAHYRTFTIQEFRRLPTARTSFWKKF